MLCKVPAGIYISPAPVPTPDWMKTSDPSLALHGPQVCVCGSRQSSLPQRQSRHALPDGWWRFLPTAGCLMRDLKRGSSNHLRTALVCSSECNHSFHWFTPTERMAAEHVTPHRLPRKQLKDSLSLCPVLQQASPGSDVGVAPVSEAIWRKAGVQIRQSRCSSGWRCAGVYGIMHLL